VRYFIIISTYCISSNVYLLIELQHIRYCNGNYFGHKHVSAICDRYLPLSNDSMDQVITSIDYRCRCTNIGKKSQLFTFTSRRDLARKSDSGNDCTVRTNFAEFVVVHSWSLDDQYCKYSACNQLFITCQPCIKTAIERFDIMCS